MSSLSPYFFDFRPRFFRARISRLFFHPAGDKFIAHGVWTCFDDWENFRKLGWTFGIPHPTRFHPRFFLAFGERSYYYI